MMITKIYSMSQFWTFSLSTRGDKPKGVNRLEIRLVVFGALFLQLPCRWKFLDQHFFVGMDISDLLYFWSFNF